ncbi:MAG: hypothetical protein U0168_02755 [Nannocystaceae bacterium]
MKPTRTASWWLVLPDGSRRRVEPWGCLLGRAADCDVVLVSEDASRRQALVYLGADGPHLVAMGRAPTKLGGDVVEGSRALLDGATIELPGSSCRIVAESVPERDGEPSWVVERVGGSFFGIGDRPLSVGSDPADGLRIDGMPPRALTFRVVDERLLVEFGDGGSLDGQAVAAGAVEAVGAGARIVVGSEAMRVIAGGGGHDATTRGSSQVAALAVTRAALEFLPHGGRLRLTVGGRERSLYLADRRCDLIACLLQPPPPLRVGEFVPDDALLPRVWPGKPSDRTAINVLVHRVRRDLVRAGIDGVALIERSAGGGGTRIVLAPRADVAVR